MGGDMMYELSPLATIQINTNMVRDELQIIKTIIISTTNLKHFINLLDKIYVTVYGITESNYTEDTLLDLLCLYITCDNDTPMKKLGYSVILELFTIHSYGLCSDVNPSRLAPDVVSDLSTLDLWLRAYTLGIKRAHSLCGMTTVTEKTITINEGKYLSMETLGGVIYLHILEKKWY